MRKDVLYDIGGALVEAVTVYRKADYSYRLSRYGYAFDSTVYDEYVRVFEHGSGGIFSGGYDSDEKDNFVWVINLEPSTEAYSYDSISNTTIHNYNADIAMHQYCTLYFPD